MLRILATRVLPAVALGLLAIGLWAQWAVRFLVNWLGNVDGVLTIYLSEVLLVLLLGAVLQSRLSSKSLLLGLLLLLLIPLILLIPNVIAQVQP